MPKKRPITAHTFTKNLKFLMSMHDISQSALAKKSGISQKAISNMARGEQTPTVETADKIAAAFGLEGWHMIMPNLPEDLINNKQLERLFHDFVLASQNGRDLIVRLAEREAEHNRKRNTA